MKIYYLKYYKGSISVDEEEISRSLYDGGYTSNVPVMIQGLKFYPDDEGEILEYSLGDIKIWITERGDFKLAYNKLRDYVIKFHNKNIKYLNGRISEEEMFLDSVQLLAIK